MKSPVLVAALVFSLCFSLATVFGQNVPDPPTRNSSLAHFRSGEILSQQGDYQAAANEFREALSGDLEPRWIEVWAHINLGEIYELTGQRPRAVNEYDLAMRTNDNTRGALTEAIAHLRSRDAEITHTAPQDLLAWSEPGYSDEARLAELEGAVVITAAGGVDQNGRLQEPRVTQSLGLGLDEKALAAVEEWRFRPTTQSASATVDFSLRYKPSRWHLIGADFRPPEGASRPAVVSAFYPAGAGVFNVSAIEEGRLLGAIGRQAFVALSFDVDEHGVPAHIQVTRTSEDVWNDQAITVLRAWRFMPGMKDGMPVSVPCTFDFAWGPRNLEPKKIAQIRDVLHQHQGPSTLLGRPEAIYNPNPAYPEQARDAGVDGTVTAMVVIGANGTPQDIRVMKGLVPVIDGSVTDALRQWRFAPQLLNGEPVSHGVIIEVNFELPDRVSSKILDPPRTAAR